MPLRQKKRWICEELEQYLLSLHPTFYISVHRRINGTSVDFPFRDDNGKGLIDAYNCDVVSIDVDYMKTGFPVETIYVGKESIESRRFPDIKEKLEAYISLFPKTCWTTELKQLGKMREQLRTALCNSMGIDFVREEGYDSPSIGIAFSTLSPEAKRRVCDLICNLYGDAVKVFMDFYLDNMNAEQIYATLDQLALYDAKKEAEVSEDEAENEPWD